MSHRNVPLQEVAELFTQILLERELQESREGVLPREDPDELRARLALSPPEVGADLDVVAERLRALVRHTPITGSATFFNQLYGGREPASLLGELVAAVTNNSMYTYKVGGAQVLAEQELIRHMARHVGLDGADGVFTPGGSLSNLTGLLLARDRARPRARSEGLIGARLRVYSSDQSHYSVTKAVGMLGLGLDNLVRVDSDARGRMDPAALEAAILLDVERGHEPMAVNATAGTTVLGAFDPLEAIADVCQRHGVWLHVDGAFGGSALLDPGQRHLLAGCERADSMAWDAHKVMGAQLSCSVILVAEAGRLAASLNESASYLFQEDGDELNPGTRSLQCGRRNDALKLWALWQFLGDQGMAERVARLRRLALHAAQEVEASDDLELVRQPEFLTVCFRVDGLRAEDVCHELRERGVAMVGFAHVDGEAVVRLAVVNAQSDEGSLGALFDGIRAIVAELRAALVA